jgi:hypothetical protein
MLEDKGDITGAKTMNNSVVSVLRWDEIAQAGAITAQENNSNREIAIDEHAS